jgi:phosphohistidine phosphatase
MAAQLWLLRHGEAVPHDATADDADRALTPRGEEQARAAGRAFRALEVVFHAVYASPKVRALDTARLACEGLGAGIEPIVHEPLREGFSAADARELLLGGDADRRILVVGHNPDLAQVAHDLTGARIELKKGGVAAVRGRELIALLQPRELTRLAVAAP